jgi:Domain of unknown function (DUF4359)
MNKILPLIVCSLGIYLIQTNPRDKEIYLDHVAHQVAETPCNDESFGLQACEALFPLTIPAMKGIFSLYTEPPKNYVFCTTYTTNLPSREIYGIGIAGKIFTWSVSSTAFEDE